MGSGLPLMQFCWGLCCPTVPSQLPQTQPPPMSLLSGFFYLLGLLSRCGVPPRRRQHSGGREADLEAGKQINFCNPRQGKECGSRVGRAGLHPGPALRPGSVPPGSVPLPGEVGGGRGESPQVCQVAPPTSSIRPGKPAETGLRIPLRASDGEMV